MRTKHLCILVHISIKGETGTVKPVIDHCAFQDGASFYPFCYLSQRFRVCLCYTVVSVPCSLLLACWERADILAL